jgi:uncharacterized protein YoxC
MTDLAAINQAGLRQDQSVVVPDQMRLDLTVTEPDVLSELAKYPDGRARNDFARGALRLGVLALKQVQARLDADLVRSEGERLLGGLEAKLAAYRETITREIAGALQQYFDPNNGRFTERVERLIKKDGELEHVLRAHVGPAESELQRTLSLHFGEGSPLLTLLAPDASKGFLASMKATVDGVVTEQRDRILKEFSLDNKAGALSRLVDELVQKHSKLTQDLQGSVKEVIGEFSLDVEDSALSRLVRSVEQAQRKISGEFSLDSEQSALARMKKELLGELAKHGESNERFQRDVVAALEALKARKEEALRSTAHGRAFEDAVFTVVQAESQKAGDIATPTGNTVGLIKNCKIGDAVITLGPDSTAAGAKIVVEAKESSNYDLEKSLTEIEEGRKNRGAAVGLFVHSRRTAPAGLAPLARYGDDIVVLWDSEDESTDIVLVAGLAVAKALSVRAHAHDKEQAVDLESLERAIRDIEKQLAGFEEITTSAKTITSGGEKIQKRVSIMQEAISNQVTELDQVLRSLRAALSIEPPSN